MSDSWRPTHNYQKWELDQSSGQDNTQSWGKQREGWAGGAGTPSPPSWGPESAPSACSRPEGLTDADSKHWHFTAPFRGQNGTAVTRLLLSPWFLGNHRSGTAFPALGTVDELKELPDFHCSRRSLEWKERWGKSRVLLGSVSAMRGLVLLHWQDHRIINHGWFGLEGTLKLLQFQPPCNEQGSTSGCSKPCPNRPWKEWKKWQKFQYSGFTLDLI